MSTSLTAEELAQRMADAVEHKFYPSLGLCEGEATFRLGEYARLLLQMRRALILAASALPVESALVRDALSSADTLLAKEQK